jgi:protocatechuate 4,5-dioxygenase alpha chain
MSLEHFDPLLRSNDLVQDVKWDPELQQLFQDDLEGLLDRYQLRPDERSAILGKDLKKLYELGLHPYLLGQLSRLFYGTGEKAATSAAAVALVQALTGHSGDE